MCEDPSASRCWTHGAGKTTLLRTITGQLAPSAGEVRPAVPARLLPQRLDVLDGAPTVADNVARFAPKASANAIRARLARTLLPDERAGQMAATLSGGELFRATLVALLLAEPAPRLLMLDEPTNNVDMPSTRQLAGALAAYRGALIVASHGLPSCARSALRAGGGSTARLPRSTPRNLARPRVVDGAGNARIAGPAP
jgi:ATPase subunit of ABC transporter with duplicated ATPase domains